MSAIVFLHPDDCTPPHGLDMDSEHDRLKVLKLARAFEANGFDMEEPALVGYPALGGKVQLLSGTHRHRAAEMTGTLLPVTLWLRSNIEGYWGFLDEWRVVMRDIPARELASWTREDLERESLARTKKRRA